MTKIEDGLGDWRGLGEMRGVVEQALSQNCRDSNELDDMVQDTMLRAARFRRGLLDRRRLRPWVLRIAWNVLHDHVRHEHRLGRVDVAEEFLLEMEGSEKPPGRQLNLCLRVGGILFDRDDLLRILKDLIPLMPESDRRLFDVFYGEGLGCKRSAERLEISQESIKMRLFRMRNRLRRELHKRSFLYLVPEEREAVA
ncbi:MAG: RNA polymerase sigma-70 factor (ECF subfamily) [Planctomycetota bacterium]|jgi:RNA polymerase sigma-70 factor (ECF subfamily)